MPTLDKGMEQSSWMMSSVTELNPTLQTVHTSPITTVHTLKMLESDVLVRIVVLCAHIFSFLMMCMHLATLLVAHKTGLCCIG